MKKTLLAVTMGAVLCTVLMLFAADKSVKNVSMMKHPNLAEAQVLIDKAFMKITAAQKANEFDMAGHAQKAKDLLEQANAEIKLAATAANENKK